MATSGFSANHLRSFITRIERLDEEAAAVNADRKEVFAEAKNMGFDTKIMRIVIRIRKMDKIDYQEQCALVDLYLSALQIDDAKRDVVKHALRPESEAAAL